MRVPAGWERVESSGAGRFESRRVWRLADGSEYVWEDRRHRKGRGPYAPSGQAAELRERQSPWLEFYAPHRLSWWVAVIFIAGSALFTLGALASLFDGLFGGEEMATTVAASSYFTGALLFTAGIYMQVLETINAGDHVGFAPSEEPWRSFRWLAWQPRRLGFDAPAVLLAGSVLFNVETALALGSSLGWVTLPVLVGVASLVGSVLFVVSCYLQLVEVCHCYLCSRLGEISWWVVALNLLGSVGFMVGSAFGFDIPGLSSPDESLVTRVAFLQGSVFFLIGSYLMLPEIFSD